MADEQEKKVVTESTSVLITPWPEWTGETIESRKYSKVYKKDGNTQFKYRLDIALPIPTTDDQAKELYNLSLAELIAKGVNQNSHDESVLTDYINGLVDNGSDFGSPELLDEMTSTVKTAHFREKKETKVSKAKENDQALAKLKQLYGMPASATPDEVYAEAAKRLAAKGKK